ncbi:MAG: hypothetical protein K2W95_15870 [Candidatus Obscuribacterales bacterium]|nr:hypothetical protein [Candidatus Obscuribacterales bacterium]
MTVRNIPGQLHIVDPDPAPDTIEAAQRFLRSKKEPKVKSTIQMNQDHDRLTVKIEASDNDGNIGSYFDECELPIVQSIERDNLIIRQAQRAHAWRKERIYGGN